jgi:hypothetical protein
MSRLEPQARDKSSEAVMGDARPNWLPCLIIQTIRQDPSRSVWTDEAPNLSRLDPSGADQIDAEHQATDLRLGVRIPRGAPKAQVSGYQAREAMVAGIWQC